MDLSASHNGTFCFDKDNIKDHPEIFAGSILFDISTGVPNEGYSYNREGNLYELRPSPIHEVLYMYAWHRGTLGDAYLSDDIFELSSIRNALLFYGCKLAAEIVDKKIRNINFWKTTKRITGGFICALITYYLFKY